MIYLRRACRGRTALRFPANSSHMCCVELALDRLLCTHLGSKGFLRRGFFPFVNSCLWLSLPAWYSRARAWGIGPAVGWCMCAPCFKFALFQCNRIKLDLFSSITVFHDISKQIQQCARIGEICARWHLAIAITGKYFRSEKRTRRGDNSIQVCSLILIKLFWIDFTSDKFDIFPSNFYQHQNFYNLLMSSCGKTMLTYKLDQQSSARRCRFKSSIYAVVVTVACVLQFQYQRTNMICEKSKEARVITFHSVYYAQSTPWIQS